MTRTPLRVYAVTAVVCLGAVAGCGTRQTGAPAIASAAVPSTAVPSSAAPSSALPSTTVPSADGQLHSSADARSVANSGLSRVQLPPGGSSLSSAPVAALRDPPVTTDGDTVVDVARWWRYTGTSADVLAYAKAHPPPGFVQGFSSTGSWGSAIGFASATTADNDQLMVSAVQAGNEVDVRVDAQVTWLPQRAPVEAIPATVTTATLDITGTLQQPGGPVFTRRYVAVSGPDLVTLVQQINAAETQAPGPPSACAPDDGQQAALALDYAGHHVVFSISIGGCGGIAVTADGKAQPGLTRDTEDAEVEKIVGVTG